MPLPAAPLPRTSAPAATRLANGRAVATTRALAVGSLAALIVLGRRFKPQSSFIGLLGGGILGAILFYLITNIASWLFNPFNNPEYTNSLTSLLIALTKGIGGWPETWQFFRNTLLSGGLFTGLFVGAMKICEAAEEAKEESDEPEEAPEAKPEESKA